MVVRGHGPREPPATPFFGEEGGAAHFAVVLGKADDLGHDAAIREAADVADGDDRRPELDGDRLGRLEEAFR
jgi:hypothetical protein